MEKSQKVLKNKIIFSFAIMIVLILISGFLGWWLTQKIEKSEKTTETIHRLKEDELQLRREEKNLIIRGYSEERFRRWQQAKEDFNQQFGQLIGMNVMTDEEIKDVKKTISEMTEAYNEFFHDIKSHNLTDEEIQRFDEHFKKIGRGSLVIIDELLQKEISNSNSVNWQTDILIVSFSIIFILISGFLVINVLRHL